ncbi:MAG: hypothetical protein N4A61_05395 [Pelagimonas sp.]|jgi:hypothetical protein|nr:hypothetical protein [Pelagimonas sp.]
MKRRLGIAVACVVVSGCADPMGQVPRLDQVQLAEGAAQPHAVDAGAPVVPTLDTSERPRTGLLGLFARKADEAKDTAPASQDPVQVAALAPEAASDVTDETAKTAVQSPQTDDAKPAKPKGLAGLFGAGAGSSSKSKKAARGPKPGAPDYQQVSLGVSLPYGQMARVCDASRAKMGKKVEGYPRRGSKVSLLDSNPESTGARNFYLTGFDDGCARQFTGALVMLGSPEDYEAIAFGASGKTLPKGETDKAYRKLRSKICRVSEKKPCKQMSKLNRSTVFVTVYERFGSNPRWKNILLHDGEVLAMDVKG